MKKLIVSLLFIIALVPFTFANGNAEKLTTVSGNAVLVKDAEGENALMIRTKNGEMVQVAIDKEELARLQIREQAQVRVQGVFLGATEQNRVQAKVFARTMTCDGTKTTLKNQIQLTEQERAQVRAYETEQKMTQTRTRTEAGAGSSSGSGSDSGSGSGGGSGSGSGLGSGSGKK